MHPSSQNELASQGYMVMIFIRILDKLIFRNHPFAPNTSIWPIPSEDGNRPRNIGFERSRWRKRIL
jgi:hypothetical protein